MEGVFSRIELREFRGSFEREDGCEFLGVQPDDFVKFTADKNGCGWERANGAIPHNELVAVRIAIPIGDLSGVSKFFWVREFLIRSPTGATPLGTGENDEGIRGWEIERFPTGFGSGRLHIRFKGLDRDGGEFFDEHFAELEIGDLVDGDPGFYYGEYSFSSGF